MHHPNSTPNPWTTLLGLDPRPNVLSQGSLRTIRTRRTECATRSTASRRSGIGQGDSPGLRADIAPLGEPAPIATSLDELALTAAEIDVLLRLAGGASNAEIAFGRRCAIGTVKVHLMRIYQKLGVLNRTQAALLGQRLTMTRARSESDRQ